MACSLNRSSLDFFDKYCSQQQALASPATVSPHKKCSVNELCLLESHVFGFLSLVLISHNHWFTLPSLLSIDSEVWFWVWFFFLSTIKLKGCLFKCSLGKYSTLSSVLFKVSFKARMQCKAPLFPLSVWILLALCHILSLGVLEATLTPVQGFQGC